MTSDDAHRAIAKLLNTKSSNCVPITMLPKPALHWEDAFTTSMIQNDLIRALAEKIPDDAYFNTLHTIPLVA